jgi:Fe-Mn family superoxide dismutase
VAYHLPDLPYDYSALEPALSGRAMEIHHGKHHRKYVDDANAALERLGDPASKDDPTAAEHALAFNLSGHLLHSMYWTCLTPGGEQRPEGQLLAAIEDGFGSFDRLAERVGAAITSTRGSGWAVLAWEPTGGCLTISQVHDHQAEFIIAAEPILVADAWEHAYYLDYQNDKATWAKTFLTLADWSAAGARFEPMWRNTIATTDVR